MANYNSLLKECLQNASEFTYEAMEVTGEPIRQVNEDGISSILLKKISKLKEKGIYTLTKSLGVDEKKTGIDFDLWIGENDKKYLRFTVQAKSFGNNDKVGQSYDMTRAQCKKIISHSEKGPHPSFPLYFLYQAINDKNLHAKHFSFLEDFKIPYSGITFSSAKNIQRILEEGAPKFEEIHRNEISNDWNKELYELFAEDDYKVGLPLYLLNDISPSGVEKFEKYVNESGASVGPLFFFFFFHSFKGPFKIHNISAREIEEKYGQNNADSELEIKHLVIINDSNKLKREREKKLKNLLDE